MSESFKPGDQVWEAFAWLDSSCRPLTKIKSAVFATTADGLPLLRYEDGQATIFWSTPAHRVFATREAAALHCIRVLADIRWRLGNAIEQLERMGGPAPSGNDAPAGIAQPVVAT